MNPDMALMYLDFVAERHAVWEARQRGDAQPWTSDPILAARKFTNVFRVLDPGSQFVLELLEPGLEPANALFRCFLYRYTNLPSTWRWMRDQLGHYPLIDDLYLVADLIKEKRALGGPVFSGAYVILPQPNVAGDKVDQAVELAARVMSTHGDAFLQAATQQDRFLVLTRAYGVGNFMAMQILTDYGYGTEFREDQFVVAGPGAAKGCLLLKDQPAFMTMAWAKAETAKLGCTVGGRVPSLMDVQNTFCEFFKYHRASTKPLTDKPYLPAHPGQQPPPVLPRNW